MSILPKDPKSRKNMLLGFKIIGDFGAAIAVPVIIFVLIGQWLDGKYNKSPWFTILAFIISMIISGRMIYHKAKEYGKEYKDLNKN